jgi:outer membrane protein assembly factor BamB
MVILTLAAVSASAAEWSRFRGSDGFGIVSSEMRATSWKPHQQVWRAALPGKGHSSPCIWGQRIYFTAARTAGNGDVERTVLCLDAESGTILWSRVASKGPGEKQHAMNSHASATCATNGRRVVAFFGRGGLHCFDMNGEPQWSQDLGTFPGLWGTAASPVIVGELVIQNCDARGPSSLAALDLASGRIVWRTDRGTMPRGGWNTPVVIDVDSSRELILNGEDSVRGYDIHSGAELWRCKSFTGRGTPIPAWGHGLLYVICGKARDAYAIKPGGRGDVTETHMAWHTPRRHGRDIGSPILIGNTVFTVNSGGTAIAYDAKTGKEFYSEKLGGRFSASPIAVNGTVFVQSESGEVVALTAGPPLSVISRNPVSQGGEIFRSTMAVSSGKFYFRSNVAAYCVAP